MTTLFKAGLGRKNRSSVCQPSRTPFFSRPSPSLSPSSTSPHPITPAPPYPQFLRLFCRALVLLNASPLNLYLFSLGDNWQKATLFWVPVPLLPRTWAKDMRYFHTRWIYLTQKATKSRMLGSIFQLERQASLSILTKVPHPHPRPFTDGPASVHEDDKRSI